MQSSAVLCNSITVSLPPLISEANDMELNPTYTKLKDLQQRTLALRGYL